MANNDSATSKKAAAYATVASLGTAVVGRNMLRFNNLAEHLTPEAGNVLNQSNIQTVKELSNEAVGFTNLINKSKDIRIDKVVNESGKELASKALSTSNELQFALNGNHIPEIKDTAKGTFENLATRSSNNLKGTINQLSELGDGQKALLIGGAVAAGIGVYHAAKALMPQKNIETQDMSYEQTVSAGRAQSHAL